MTLGLRPPPIAPPLLGRLPGSIRRPPERLGPPFPRDRLLLGYLVFCVQRPVARGIVAARHASAWAASALRRRLPQPFRPLNRGGGLLRRELRMLPAPAPLPPWRRPPSIRRSSPLS